LNLILISQTVAISEWYYW